MKKDEKGIITLEACIFVTLFLIFMLTLSQLFIMFMAQNTTAHVVLETSESLSLDIYSASKKNIGSGDNWGSIGEFIGKFFDKTNNDSFSSFEKWNEDENKLPAVIKKRFIGFLAGGDEKEADTLLKNLNIVDGVNGLDFSKSYIEGDVLYIILKYQLKYDVRIKNLEVEQKACSKLWK